MALSAAFSEYVRANGVPFVNWEDYCDFRFLNKGGFGVCYQAKHKQTNQLLAFKFSGYTDNNPSQRYIEKEIETDFDLNELKYSAKMFGYFLDTPEGILSTIDATVKKRYKEPWLVKVSECLSHHLHQYIKNKIDMKDVHGLRPGTFAGTYEPMLSQKHASKLLKQLLLAVEEFQAKNIIHCDLKLENIMFSDDQNIENIRIIDFGNSCKGPHHLNSQLVGTLDFLAPESFTMNTSRQYTYSFKSDVFQLGVILHIFLLGKHPFSDRLIQLGGHRGVYRVDRRGEEWEREQMLAHSAREILSAMLQGNPLERPSVTDLLQYEFITNYNDLSSDDLRTEKYCKLFKTMDYHKLLKERIQRAQAISKEAYEHLQRLNLLEKVNIDNGVFRALKEIFLKVYVKKCCHHHCNIADGKDDGKHKYNVCFHQFTEIIETIAKDTGLKELRSLVNVNVFNIFDFNSNNNVDYFEFFLMITLFRSKDCHGIISLEAKEKEAKEYFDVFDKNTDHHISRQELFDGFQFLLTELIGHASDTSDRDLELMQKKIDADLSEIVERILGQNSNIIDDNYADQIDFATFLEIYSAIADYKSSQFSGQSVPSSPTIAIATTKRKDKDEGGGESKKMQKKI